MVDYISTTLQYPCHITVQNSSLNLPNEIVHQECGQVRCYMQRLGREWVIHYFTIPTSRVSVFKLGRVFALFSQLTQ